MLQRAGHGAHLIVQEGARRSDDLDALALTAHVETLQRAHRRIRLAFRGAKGREVVTANERLRRFMHGLRVERPLDVPGAAEV